LKHLARACVTPHHAHHYLGFADTQWKLFLGENPPRVKPLLYVYRVLLTGLWLLRTGEIEANLANLNETFRIPGLVDLMARKTAGAEQSALDDANSLSHHETQYNRLRDELLAARETNPARLPEAPSAETRAALNALLLRLRS
jgi:predicted nucleotidyltransferase